MAARPHGPIRRFVLASAALGAVAWAPSLADEGAPERPAAAAHSIGPHPWDARAVEHLFNRAAFGLRESEIAALVQRDPVEVVEELISGGRAIEPFPVTRLPIGHQRKLMSVPEAEREGLKKSLRMEDRRQMHEYGLWWIDHMLAGSDPLRDRMTLFWHGLFATNAAELRRNYEVVRQQLFLREHALESYADMLAQIVRDPAMLYYLDNTSNKAGSPNENLARELMELFSLGLGNYTEQDVREVARALTGFTADREGDFQFDESVHDAGTKTILGETGAFDGDDVVAILLRQDACAEWIALRIIAYLEGTPPDTARTRKYAALLRENGYQVRPLLRALFLDPDFYRDEVVGTRVLAPVEFVVSTAQRLGLRPPAEFVFDAAASLGQHLFEPPNVKGWEEGEAWITTASMLQRGNVAALMLGVLELEDAGDEEVAPMSMQPSEMMDTPRGRRAARGRAERGAPQRMEAMEPRMDPDAQGERGGPQLMRSLARASGEVVPPINLTWRMQRAGAQSDAQIVERMLEMLLAIEPSPVLRAPLVQFVRGQRELLEIEDGRLLADPDVSEDLLRRLAHVILSLPEAQLD